MDKVGIVDGSGFIGSHMTREFIDHNFKVEVSTTDISNKGKYAHLLKLNHTDKLVNTLKYYTVTVKGNGFRFTECGMPINQQLITKH